MPGSPIEHFYFTIEEWSGPFSVFIEPLTDINVVFDVGANAGGFSHVIRKKFPKAFIYAIEPIQKTFDFLTKNSDNIICINNAVQYGTKETKMYWRGENIGAYFTGEVNVGNDKIFSGETVTCIELEDLAITPDLVKLDVEGAEENIISNSTLLKTVRFIILEWHPEHVPVIPFLKEHLPNHEILINLENKQFLLCLNSQF